MSKQQLFSFLSIICIFFYACEKEEQIKKSNIPKKEKAPNYFKGTINGIDFTIHENSALYNESNNMQGGSSSSSNIEYKSFGLNYYLNDSTTISIYLAKSYHNSILTDTLIHHGGRYIFKKDEDFHDMFNVGPKVFFYSTPSEGIPTTLYHGVYIRLSLNYEVWESYYLKNGVYYSDANINDFEILEYNVLNKSYNPDGNGTFRSGNVKSKFSCRLYSKTSSQTLDIHNIEFRGDYVE